MDNGQRIMMISCHVERSETSKKILRCAQNDKGEAQNDKREAQHDKRKRLTTDDFLKKFNCKLVNCKLFYYLCTNI